jgi:hypothetical protein
MANKRGRKRTNNLYFGAEQEEAVVKYLNIGITLEHFDEEGKAYYVWSGSTKQKRERDKVYLDYLHEPLTKMVESIIRTYKLYRKGYTFEDLHADALSFLLMKANKFDEETGNKAYSYYGTIIKNYLLGLVQKDEKNLKKFASYEENFEEVNERDELTYVIELEGDSLLMLITDVTDSIQKKLDEDEAKDFTVFNENERRVGNALIQMLLDWDKVLDEKISESKKYDKLVIYETLRNLTKLNTKEMRKAINPFKEVYKLFKNEYIKNDLF